MNPTFNKTTRSHSRSPCTSTPRVLENLGAACVELENLSPDDTLEGVVDATITEKSEDAGLRDLESVLNELFCEAQCLKKINFEDHRHRLTEVINRMLHEKQMAFNRLDFIRRQLIELEGNSSEKNVSISKEDSGFLSFGSDNDLKLIDTLRKRISTLNDNIFELKKVKQNMDIKSKELESILKTEKEFSNRTSDVLREIADLLSSLTGKPIIYNHLYNKKQPSNSFCDAIQELEQINFNREQELAQSLEESQNTVKELQQELKRVQEELEQFRKQELTSKDNGARIIKNEQPSTSAAASFLQPNSEAKTFVTTTTAEKSTAPSSGLKAQQIFSVNPFFAKTE